MFHFNLTAASPQGWAARRDEGRVGECSADGLPQTRRGTLQLRGMSAPALHVPAGGSPLLFQTGETYKGEPIVTRSTRTTSDGAVGAYTTPWRARDVVHILRLPGEPALAGRRHARLSAAETTSATLGHQLQDSRTSPSGC